MKTPRLIHGLVCAAALVAFTFGPPLRWSASAADSPLPAGEPSALGFDPARLEAMHSVVDRFVDDSRHSGIITLVARDGKIADLHAHGFRDLENQLPMERDTIFRVYSMSKIATTVAAMILFENGGIGLDDPVSRFIPAFAEMKVVEPATPGDSDLHDPAEGEPELVDATRPITVRHLLTHTSGMTYGSSGDSAVHRQYKKAGIWDLDSLESFATTVAGFPLLHHPGEKFTYGVSTDILGRVIEVAADQPFDAFLKENVLDPLGMNDTAFHVPREKQARLAKTYRRDEGGRLMVAELLGADHKDAGRDFPSGGGGLFSTIDDYARLGQMLLNGGTLDGHRILGRKTVELMTAVNHLEGIGDATHGFSDTHGFGFGGSIRLTLAGGNTPGSISQFGWGGAATTYFNIDPKEGTIALFFAQHFPYNEHGVFDLFSTLFYSALKAR